MNWLKKNKLFIFVLISSSFFVLLNAEAKDDSWLEVSFLDVGQGDAIYIKAFNQTDMLIDTGRSASVLERRLAETMDSSDDRIDILVLTHPDEDHIGGTSFVLEEYKIGAIFISGNFSDNANYNQALKLAEIKNVPVYLAKTGTNIYLDNYKKTKFEILYPDKDVSFEESNKSSIIGRLVYGENEFMLTGDAYVSEEDHLVASGFNIASDILKLGHHGSKTSSSVSFLKAVKPEVAIVSASKNNTYGHPHPEITKRVSQLGIKILETSQNGTIGFKSNREKIYLK